MDRLEFKNMILIGGSGRNVGKTHLCCRIIRSLSKKPEVVAVKISSHFHELSDGLIYEAGDYMNWLVMHETDKQSHKDSSRYYRAGATEVFYAQVKSYDYLPSVINWLSSKLKKDIPVVCESTWIGNFINPGLGYFIKSTGALKKCTWSFPFYVIKSKEGEINNIPGKFIWNQKSFELV